MYQMALHLHVTAVVISLSLFAFRFVLSMKAHPMLQKKWLKILPHVVDTALLGSAIWLLTLSPMVGVDGWVASKVIGVSLYIVSGFFALKWAKNNRSRVIGFACAVIWVMLTASIAYSKQPFSFLV
ncbi:SirB2 family protein [Glaciecola sp. MH2013]|uniref:SirB2 family protein n=1 Tax=Glaciecola sp. MH2013 TaxID=2785524 RepID=UPI0018A0ECC6|nr:SirB2 family protein [Glaciecola sp. MH2013]MBF7072565.1 SirB2 family protein [Glaciecola sp. MH2013]